MRWSKDKTGMWRKAMTVLTLLLGMLLLVMLPSTAQADASLETPNVVLIQNGPSIGIAIDPVEGATGYQILLERDNGQFRWMATVSHTGSRVIRSYQGSAGKTYRFKVKAYRETASGREFSADTQILTASIPSRPAQTRASVTVENNTITLTWDSVENASGYEVYQSTGMRYTRLRARISASSSPRLVVNGTPGTTYRYLIRSFRTVGGRKIYSTYSPVVKASVTSLAERYTPDIPDPSGSVNGTTITLSWKAVSQADGYQILKHNGITFRWLQTIPASGDISVNIPAEEGSVNQFVVKSYREIDGTRYYSKNSPILTLTVPYTDSNRKILAIGDSRMYMMYQYGMYNNWPEYSRFSWLAKSSIGYAWLSTTADAQIDSYLDGSTDIFIWLGTNDAGYLQRYLDYYNEKIPGWRQKGANVYLLAVGPIDYDPWLTDEDIHQYNAGLQTVQGATYVPIYEELISSGFKTTDGVHYDADSTRIVYDRILSISMRQSL